MDAMVNPCPVLPGCHRLGTWLWLSVCSYWILYGAAGKPEFDILFGLNGLGLSINPHKTYGESVSASTYFGKKDGVWRQGDSD